MPRLTQREQYKSAHDIFNDVGALLQGFGSPNLLMMGSRDRNDHSSKETTLHPSGYELRGSPLDNEDLFSLGNDSCTFVADRYEAFSFSSSYDE